MGFFKAKKSSEDVKEMTGGKYISKSGIYDVNVIVPFVDTNDKGSMTVNFFVNHQDQEQVIYGNLRITNNDGSENKIGASAFNKFLVITDVDDVSEPEEAMLPIGKKGAEKEVAVLSDLSDFDCKIRVQLEYSVYNNDIKEKTIIKNFYRADGATAEEIVNGAEPGTQLEKDMAYAENVTYKDSLDESTVAKWIADGRPKGTGSNGTAATATKKPSFGSRPKFGKSE